ncbi:MAG: PilZ domain-containing protein [Deltaproteobacteria bacterium]|nr:PilZ domain-containing protein [Deltaproteobacteria bacterium]
MADDRRATPHVFIATTVRLEAGSALQRYKSINLSSEGVFLETAKPLAVGSQCLLRFEMPGAGKVEAHGVVKHHGPLRIQDPDQPARDLAGMGISFVRIEGAGAQALADQIKALTLKKV